MGIKVVQIYYCDLCQKDVTKEEGYEIRGQIIKDDIVIIDGSKYEFLCYNCLQKLLKEEPIVDEIDTETQEKQIEEEEVIDITKKFKTSGEYAVYYKITDEETERYFLEDANINYQAFSTSEDIEQIRGCYARLKDSYIDELPDGIVKKNARVITRIMYGIPVIETMKVNTYNNFAFISVTRGENECQKDPKEYR